MLEISCFILVRYATDDFNNVTVCYSKDTK